MDFNVGCPCGRQFTVTEGAAGTDRRCDCGNTVAIPSLAALRVSAGLPAIEISPWQVIHQKLLNGDLPPRGCVVCGMDTQAVLPCTMHNS